MVFFYVCGSEAVRQQERHVGKEGGREVCGVWWWWAVAQQLLYLFSSPPFSAPSLSPLTLLSGRYLSVIPGMLEITIASSLIQGLSPLTGKVLTPLCTSLP